MGLSAAGKGRSADPCAFCPLPRLSLESALAVVAAVDGIIGFGAMVYD